MTSAEDARLIRPEENGCRLPLAFPCFALCRICPQTTTDFTQRLLNEKDVFQFDDVKRSQILPEKFDETGEEPP
jgi:hypothetical protein